MEEEALRAMMPMGFGKQAKPQVSAAKAPTRPAEAKVETPSSNGMPSVNATTNGGVADDGTGTEFELDNDGLTAEEREANRIADEEAARKGDDSDEDEDDSDDEVDFGPEPISVDVTASIPMEDKVVLSDHKKAISALAIDQAGARIATGSYDYEVKLWDFGGMSQSFKPFKTFEPFESHLVHDLDWSLSGDQLLAATGTAQAKLYDREGNEICVYKKGDVYIRDMKNTDGHVAELTSCFWHPNERQIFATSSADSTIRLWDAENRLKQQTVVVVKSKERGTRTKVTCAGFSHDGKMLAGGCLDGALHLWSTSGTYSRPNATIEGAHAKDTEMSSLCFSRDGRTLATRGGDATVKLWDIRNFKKALAVCTDLPNSYAQTNVIFSLDETAILTGTSVTRADTGDDFSKGQGAITQSGAIEVLSRSDLSRQKSIKIEGEPSSSVIKLHWHSKINQLFASTSSGAVHLYYSSHQSSRGALLCVDKKARTRHRGDDIYTGEETGPIITPGARDSNSRGEGTSVQAKKRKLEKMRQDPRISRIPERPLDGPGKGGRIGAAATQHMVQNIFKDNSRSEDPREALLKYASASEKDPKWTAAWKETQPKTIYAREDNEGDGSSKGDKQS